MLYVFGFERTAVVLSDLYFVDPDPKIKGQESPEHGVRLEVRKISPGPLQGSIYSAQPIEIGDLIWRVDLLESVDGPPGSFDRTHHHPGVSRGLEPGRRVFDEGCRPRRWSGSGISWPTWRESWTGRPWTVIAAHDADAQSLRDVLPEVLEALTRLLDRVQSGELGRPPAEGPLASARAGWL